MRQGKGLLNALFGSGPGVGLGVAHGKRGLVLNNRFVALVLNVENAAEIDVRPGEHARIARQPEGLAEGGFCLVNVSGHEACAGENEIRPSGFCRMLLERGFRETGGALSVALHQVEFSQIKAVRSGGRPTNDVG